MKAWRQKSLHGIEIKLDALQWLLIITAYKNSLLIWILHFFTSCWAVTISEFCVLVVSAPSEVLLFVIKTTQLLQGKVVCSQQYYTYSVKLRSNTIERVETWKLIIMLCQIIFIIWTISKLATDCVVYRLKNRKSIICYIWPSISRFQFCCGLLQGWVV